MIVRLCCNSSRITARTSQVNNGANVVQSHHERTRLNPPYCYTERPTTHHQDKINTWTTSTAFESVATGRLLSAFTWSFAGHAVASPLAGRSRRLIISHASHRGHDISRAASRAPSPVRTPCGRLRCGFGCPSRLSCLMPPPENAPALTPPWASDTTA